MTPAPPPPLTSRQRATFWIVAVVCAATRFLALAKTLWWWDEALFCLGMRSYDITQHQPHPPGFPVYVGAAHLVRFFTGSDFHALQTLNILGGVLLFPALFLLARELGFRFNTATIAAALCAFFPNVWFFGGTALSDVPSITLAVFAAAMLFRGCRDVNAYFIGTFALALAIGIRPQNFLIGLFPGLLATWYRGRESKRDVVFAALLGTAMSLGAFAAAAIATGDAETYMRAVREHSDYISRVDSFHSPSRPALWKLFPRFFFQQYQSAVLGIITSLFVVFSVAAGFRRRDRPVIHTFLTFAPVAVMAWLMLDRFSINRFSIGYAPMFALLAADGIARVAKRFERQHAEELLGGALIAAFVIWTIPAFDVVRNEKTPPVQAIEAMKKRVDPKRDALYVGFSVSKHVDYLAPEYPYVRLREERSLPLSAPNGRAFFLTEFENTPPSGMVFRRDPSRLISITRSYYYDVALRPMAPALPRFVSGWHAPERFHFWESRWMTRRSVTELPPLTGPAKLEITYEVTPELIAQEPVVTVILNGKVLEQFIVTQPETTREFDVIGAAQNVLELTTTRSFRDGEKEMGLKVKDLVWGPRSGG